MRITSLMKQTVGVGLLLLSGCEVARSARTMLGGAGITLDHSVMRHMNNLETVLTYEGTEEMHLLSIGAAVTGINAFR